MQTLQETQPLLATRPLLIAKYAPEATGIAHERTSKIFQVLQYNYLVIPVVFGLVHQCMPHIPFLGQL
jgi:hypothetical protein